MKSQRFRRHYSDTRGLGVIEIFLVFVAITLLVSILVVVSGPTRQLRSARDAQRSSDVVLILGAIQRFGLDHAGSLPGSISGEPTEICRTDALSCRGLIDLSQLTDNGVYLNKLPLDPTGKSRNGTGYEVSVDKGNRITVRAPYAEGKIIQARR